MSTADDLVAVPFLRFAPPSELRASAPLWSTVTLGPDEELWAQGEPVDALGLVVEGELVVEQAGTVVGRLTRGDALGEAAAFLGEGRHATRVTAKGHARVVALPIGALHGLRVTHADLFDTLLELCLHSLTRRLGDARRSFARAAPGGSPVPARVEPSVLLRLWKALVPGGPTSAPPPLAPLLRFQSGLQAADDGVIEVLSRAFVGESVSQGAVIFLEGETRSAAWLLGEGTVAAYRNVRGDRAELLNSYEPGAFIGSNALVEPGVRTVSCVATTPCWLYRIDTAAVARIQGRARREWRGALLGILAAEVRAAEDALQGVAAHAREPIVRVRTSLQQFLPERAAAPSAPKNAELTALLKDSGWAGEVPDDLSSVDVVISDEDRRKPRNGRRAAG
jgi:CRP-like cAMP-binding protein